MTNSKKDVKEADGWIYYIGSNDGLSGLFKAKHDDSQTQLLYEEVGRSVGSVGTYSKP